ncbi:hypothetical protein GGI42DRAFT_331651 [Trichoderma sp. SZMC 28013]
MSHLIFCLAFSACLPQPRFLFELIFYLHVGRCQNITMNNISSLPSKATSLSPPIKPQVNLDKWLQDIRSCEP